MRTLTGCIPGVTWFFASDIGCYGFGRWRGVVSTRVAELYADARSAASLADRANPEADRRNTAS